MIPAKKLLEEMESKPMISRERETEIVLGTVCDILFRMRYQGIMSIEQSDILKYFMGAHIGYR